MGCECKIKGALKDYDNVFVQQANLFTIDVLPSATHLFCTTLGMDPSTCLHVLYIIVMTVEKLERSQDSLPDGLCIGLII